MPVISETLSFHSKIAKNVEHIGFGAINLIEFLIRPRIPTPIVYLFQNRLNSYALLQRVCYLFNVTKFYYIMHPIYACIYSYLYLPILISTVAKILEVSDSKKVEKISIIYFIRN